MYMKHMIVLSLVASLFGCAMTQEDWDELGRGLAIGAAAFPQGVHDGLQYEPPEQTQCQWIYNTWTCTHE